MLHTTLEESISRVIIVAYFPLRYAYFILQEIGVGSKSIPAVKRGSEGLCSCRVSKAFLSELKADETIGYRQNLVLMNRCNGAATVVKVGPPQGDPYNYSHLEMELFTN